VNVVRPALATSALAVSALLLAAGPRRSRPWERPRSQREPRGRRASAAFDPFGLTFLEILSEQEDRRIRERDDFLRMSGLPLGPSTCDALRRVRAELREERQELRVRRELAAGPRQRQQVQETINTLDIQLEDIERQIAERCTGATPPATDPGGPPEAFSTTWAQDRTLSHLRLRNRSRRPGRRRHGGRYREPPRAAVHARLIGPRHRDLRHHELRQLPGRRAPGPARRELGGQERVGHGDRAERPAAARGLCGLPAAGLTWV